MIDELSKICPCHECICMPVCRNKRFSLLMKECGLVLDFYYKAFYSDGTTFNARLAAVIESLKKPYWSNGVTPYWSHK